MTEEEWGDCLSATRKRLSERKLRLFAVACCRRVRHHLKEACYHDAVLLGEQLADGTISSEGAEMWCEGCWRTIENWREFLPANHDLYRPFFYAAIAASAIAVPPWLSLPWPVVLEETNPYVPREFYENEDLRFEPWTMVVNAVAAADCQSAWDEIMASGDDADEERLQLKAREAGEKAHEIAAARTRAEIAGYLREVVGPSDGLPEIPSSWLAWNDATIPRIAQAIYDGRRARSGLFDNQRMGVLADALEDAGCANTDILNHCRLPGEHFRGCWVVDALLGKA